MRPLTLAMLLLWSGCWRSSPTVSPRGNPREVAKVATVNAEDRNTPSSPRARSVAIAGLLPLGTTVVGCFTAVAIGGRDGPWSIPGGIGAGIAAVAPSAGRVYVGDPWNLGMIGTVGGMTMFMAGARIDDGAAAPGDGFLLALLGLGLYSTGALYQIISAPVIADRINRRPRANLSLVPHQITTPTTVVPGLSLIGSW